MTVRSRTTVLQAPPTVPPRALDRRHALFRGGYVAAVFCGHREVLGELAGEVTALTPGKFVLNDPALSAGNDFARSSGSTLPRWPGDDVRPVGGVCFVFTSERHPAIACLLANDAVPGEHFIVISGIAEDCDFSERLAAFIGTLRRDGKIVLLGYGHQGRGMAACLREELHVPARRLLVHDRSAISRMVAEQDGLCATEDDGEISQAAAIVATPLARYPHIAVLLERARSAGISVFDNARQSSDLQQWTRNGRLLLDEAAARIIAIRDRQICCETLMEGTAAVHIVREDERVLGGVHLPHLLSGASHACADGSAIDLAEQWRGDGLAPQTFGGLRRAFISLSGRPSSGFFAARELCLDLWPHATRQMFPSAHAIDLGVTGFERLLKGHLDAREMVTTMQTPAQRVTLGAAAAHYAKDRPIIELGSALGGSALLMATATADSNSSIVSVDPDAATRDIMRFAFHREGFGDRLQQIVKTSDDAIAELMQLEGACGLVFVDGLHTAQAVLSDFRNYAPLVAIGGALAFHDVCPAIHPVMQAVIEHVLPDHRFVAKCLVDGLLVLERAERD